MKRQWSPEQRAAAAERARIRFGKKVPEEVQPVRREIAPEVQAVIATMDPQRRAKLEQIQAKNLATLAQTKEGRDALERLEQRHRPVEKISEKNEKESIISVLEQPKPVVREIPLKAPFRITGSQSGMCVSEMGPCQCGEPKLKWHPICLKQKV